MVESDWKFDGKTLVSIFSRVCPTTPPWPVLAFCCRNFQKSPTVSRYFFHGRQMPYPTHTNPKMEDIGEDGYKMDIRYIFPTIFNSGIHLPSFLSVWKMGIRYILYRLVWVWVVVHFILNGYGFGYGY